MKKLLEYVEDNTDDVKFFEFALEYIFELDCIKDNFYENGIEELENDIISEYNEFIS